MQQINILTSNELMTKEIILLLFFYLGINTE